MSQVAVITGITSGIGQAIKTSLEAKGWKVIGIARRIPMSQEGYEADLSLLESVEPVATRIGEECGPIDAFIHVAGVWHDESGVLAGKRLDEFSTKQIVSTMNVGLTSAMVMSARLMRFMSGTGKMIFISATFQDNGANWLPYYTSKRGLEDFIKGLGQEQQRVKIFGVAPGPTSTQARQQLMPSTIPGSQSPEAVAKVCISLIENELSADSGMTVRVDGGLPGVGYHS